MEKLKKLELTMMVKLAQLGPEMLSDRTTQTILILSVLLGGNCLTVARVGIIMISLKLGDFFTMLHTTMSLEQV